MNAQIRSTKIGPLARPRMLPAPSVRNVAGCPAAPASRSPSSTLAISVATLIHTKGSAMAGRRFDIAEPRDQCSRQIGPAVVDWCLHGQQPNGPRYVGRIAHWAVAGMPHQYWSALSDTVPQNAASRRFLFRGGDAPYYGQQFCSERGRPCCWCLRRVETGQRWRRGVREVLLADPPSGLL